MNNNIISKKLVFNQEVTINFSELNDNLYDHVYNKLSCKEFTDKTFEVIEIEDFKVIEMKVGNNCKVICNIEVKGICNDVSIGEKINIINNFTINENNFLVYINGKFQIVSQLKTKSKKGPFILKIDNKKIIANNIICTASHIIE